MCPNLIEVIKVQVRKIDKYVVQGNYNTYSFTYWYVDYSFVDFIGAIEYL